MVEGAQSQLQVLPMSAEAHDTCDRPRDVIAVAHQSASASVQFAAQSATAQVSEGALVGPGKDTHGTPVPNSVEAVGGPINRYSTTHSADVLQTWWRCNVDPMQERDEEHSQQREAQ